MEPILLILLLVVFLAIPFFQIRKQNKRLREIREFQSELQVGQEVKTSSGVHGTITAVNELTVVLDIANDVQVTWDRAAILEYVNQPEAAASEENSSVED